MKTYRDLQIWQKSMTLGPYWRNIDKVLSIWPAISNAKI